MMLRTVTGDTAPIEGELDVDIRLGGTRFDHIVLVADIEDEFILGMDIIREHGFTFDPTQGILRLGDESFVLSTEGEKCEGVRLFACENGCVSGNCEGVIMTVAEAPLGSGVGLIEPTCDARQNLLVARAIVKTADKKVPVRLANVFPNGISIRKGDFLAVCSPISRIATTEGTNCQSRVNRVGQTKLEIDLKDLTEDEARMARAFIKKNQDAFSTGNGKLGRTDLVQHKIYTGNARPVRQPPRRVPMAKRDEVVGLLHKLKQDGVIEESNSPWSSPVVLVTKKDGSTRFCVDYRKLNEVTKKDSYPLPRIDDTLTTLAGSSLFSTLDLKSGYWQVGVHPADREKTVFSTGNGLYQFTVMPFGLCNAPATFERLMELVLRGLTWKTCLVYLDDVMVMGRTFGEHLKNLQEIFNRFKAANLGLNPRKCQLFQKKVEFLGHTVSAKGIQTSESKILAIRDWPKPKDKHELRSFLGLCTYYRRFVEGFADIAAPLHRLTEAKSTFHWNQDCENAFVTLKGGLCSSPVLVYPQPGMRFVLDTDASNSGIGAVLSQVQDGEERVIEYYSKILTKPERNYCATRRELLAIVRSVEHFHRYLYGQDFLVRTDHAALTWLLQMKNPEGQVARWLEKLQQYHFQIRHRPGKRHHNADALSRRPCGSCKHCEKIDKNESEATSRGTTVVPSDEWTPASCRASQQQDLNIGPILESKENGNLRPSWEIISDKSPALKALWAQWDSLRVENGLLKRVWESADGRSTKMQLVVPEVKIPCVLREVHSGASGSHFGVTKTLRKVRERFYWVYCREDVEIWCRRCTTCAASKGPQTRSRGKMREYNVGAPFERIAIDVAGPFPVTEDGNKYLLVAMDYFTKWPEVYAIPNQEAATVARVLVDNLICRFGVPLELHSDQGRNFESEIFRELCQVLGIWKTRTTPLHPQSDGMVERFNKTMVEHLSKVVEQNQRDWDRRLPLFLMAYRAAIHETTGQTPAKVMFGRELRLPCDLEFGTPGGPPVEVTSYVGELRGVLSETHKLVREKIQLASHRMKTHYDLKANHEGFKENDLVWMFNPKRKRGLSPKLTPMWEGPYKVVKRINDLVYRIQRSSKAKPRVVHLSRLALFQGEQSDWLNANLYHVLVLRRCKKTSTYVFPRDAAERDLASTETFDFSTPNEWPKWRKRFERYLVVSGMKKKEEADKIDLFMYLMGDRADDIFRTFKFEEEEEATKIDSVLKAFDSHFCVRKNIIYERAKFNSRIQEDREPVDEFITSLYKLADSCEFEGLHEQLIRDRIVVGVRDKALSERMQLDSELTLEKAVKMVRQQEAVRQQQVDLQRPSTSQKVDQVKFNSKKQSPKQQQQPSRKKEKSAKTRSRCPKCGGFTHREGQACRAEGQKCNLCSKTGHFANCCPDKQAKTAEVKAVSELDEEIGFLLEVSSVEDSSNLYNDEDECRRRWTAEIQVNGKKVKFKLDSQADVTCVPLCLFKKMMGQQRLVESDINIRAAEFSELQTVGMFISTLRNGNYEIKEKIYVIRRLSEPLLSRRACELLNLARRIEVVATRINPIKDEMLTKIFEAQQEDTTLKAVVNYLEQGWPDKKKMSQALLSYWHVKDELGVQNGLLMRSCRLVIPASMKLEILDKLHAGHFGITKTRLRARETVWWPGISEEIAETVRKCSVCIQEAVSKHEPLIPTNFPTRPWQKIGMDLFKFENKWYLVVIDYYSRYPEMVQLDRLTASVVVRSCKSIFARHGVPETVVSDNGTQFGAAREFANFARQYGFTHVTSSPRFPQSNGMAEAGVKIAKLILKKNQDPSLGLLEYRSTPLENGYSPAELLMGRKLRTTLPIAPENLNPKLVDSQTLKRKEGRRRKDMKSRYDRRCGATDMEELSEGDTVWITDMRTWGIVKKKASTPRSYMVDTPVGTLRRNRFHLRKGVTVQYPADPSTPTFSGEELVENEKTPVVDYPSNDSEDGQIRTRSGRIVKPDYERIARSNCWDARMKLANAPFFLEGTAGQWYDNNEEGMDSWDMFKEMFSRTFDNSGVLLRRAKDNLQSRAQKSTESCESYIQDVLSLCRQVNPDMSKEEKVAHLMKGVVEDVYQVILIKEIDTVEAFVDWCRKVEACKQRRIGKPRFERLPNVASIEQPNSSSLEDLIRRIVREEIKSALHSESIVPEVNSLKKIIHEEVERNLTPIAEQGPYYREQRRQFEGPAKPPPYYQQQSPTRLTTARRKTDEWRTVDNIPVCFQCGRPGHVARYCRERRGMVDRQPPGRYHPVQNGPRTIYNSNETSGRTGYRSPSPYPGRGRSPAERRPSISPSRRSGRSPYPAKLSQNIVDVTIDDKTFPALVDSGASFSVISDHFRQQHKKTMFSDAGMTLRVADGKYIVSRGRCTLRLEINGLVQPFEFIVLPSCSHDIILGWDFLEASRAIIDCGSAEILLEKAELPEDSSSIFQTVAADDSFIIPAGSTKQINVISEAILGVSEVVMEPSRILFLERDLMVPASIFAVQHGKGRIWITNIGTCDRTAPKGMCIGEIQVLEEGQLAVIDDASDTNRQGILGQENSPNIASMISPDLSMLERTRICSILGSFSGLFEFNKFPSNLTSTAKHKINTEDHPPIKRRPYRVSQVERQTIQNEVDKMLKGGIVQLSESPWSSPVVLVKKKNGSWRFCVDYRHLNKITKKDVYPLPRIDDTLDCLRGASYYSSMDLRSGYWQIEVDEADREKTAFITPDGLYEFKVMPFGLCNAPATFERMMDTLLRGLKWSMCLCYLDDIIVFSPTFDEHVRRLELVLRCLSKAGLVLNSDKCLLGTKRLSIFGNLVDGEGVHPDPGKVDAMSKFPTPKSLTDVRSFIGMCSYYRRFIKNFAQKAEPLHRLLRKDTRFEWGPDQRQAYESLKLALASEPVLAHFDEKDATELHTDASGFGIGAVLVQVQGGSEKPIGYASRTLSTAEKIFNNGAGVSCRDLGDRQVPSIPIWALVYNCDGSSLALLAFGPEGPVGKTGQVGLKTSGVQCERGESEDDIPTLAALTDIVAEQRKDPVIVRISEECLKNDQNRFKIINGALYKRNFDPVGQRWLLVIPRHLRPDVLRSLHDNPTAGHLGLAKTHDRIRRKYFWPGLLRSIRKYVGHCRECQRRKHAPLRPPGLLQPIPPTSVPFQRVGIDLLGRFPISHLGNKWIIVCTDYLTRYAITRALPSADAQQVAKFVLEDVVLKHGAPREIITDRGRVFQSKLISELTGLCSSAQRFTTAYHPQTNGLNERLNKTLADMLSMYVDVEQKEWDVILPFITFAYNTAKQDTTGFTPFSLIHGREAETTLDTLFPLLKDEDQEDYNREIVTRAEETRQLARLHTLRAQEGNKRLYDAKHREVSYQPGDKVWIFIPVRKIGISEKLIKRYFGPYRVTRRISDVTYEVESLDTTNRRRKPKEIVHVVRMKNYRDPDEQLDLPEDEPAVEDIETKLDHLVEMYMEDRMRMMATQQTCLSPPQPESPPGDSPPPPPPTPHGRGTPKSILVDKQASEPNTPVAKSFERVIHRGNSDLSQRFKKRVTLRHSLDSEPIPSSSRTPAIKIESGDVLDSKISLLSSADSAEGV
ncbi:K02A2.6-like, partial [Cordylochernes scorpioides]